MKKRIKNTLMLKATVAMLLFIPTNVYAASWSNWIVPTDIDDGYGTGITVRASAALFPTTPLEGCSNYTAVRLNPNRKNYKESVAIVMTALAMGYEMRFRVSGCNGSYPMVDYVRIKR